MQKPCARAKRGINARYIRTCTYASRQRHTRRIAITAGNFARNFAIIQFGHDLLGMKPNSKAAAGPSSVRRSDFASPSRLPSLLLSSIGLWISSVTHLMNRSRSFLPEGASIFGASSKLDHNTIRSNGLRLLSSFYMMLQNHSLQSGV